VLSQQQEGAKRIPVSLERGSKNCVKRTCMLRMLRDGDGECWLLPRVPTLHVRLLRAFARLVSR
jgi:hypothetical protein